MKSKKIISIITPCYNEEDNIQECYQRVKDVFIENLVEYDYEHIFTDNFSTDNTVEILREIANGDKRVRVIINSRNFGVFPSTFNAIMRSSSDAVIPMLCADLQDPPELIPEFVRKWEQGFEVVAGDRRVREENLILRTLRRLYYRVVTTISDFYIPPNVGEFQIIDKVVVDALRKFDDYNPYIRGMIANCGFNTAIIKYKHASRKRGKSKFNIFSYIDMSLNGIISFSRVPMRIAFFLGFLIAMMSIVWSLYLLIEAIVYGTRIAQPGIMSMLIGLFFFSGIILLFLGLLGEYISAIHSQVRKKPLVIEKETINF